MTLNLQIVINLVYPLIILSIIMITITRKNINGKGWLLGFLIGSFAIWLLRFMPGLMAGFGLIEMSQFATFFDNFGIPLDILNIIFLGFLIPYLLTISKPNLDLDTNQTKIKEKNKSMKIPFGFLIGGVMIVLFRFTLLESLLPSNRGSLYGSIEAANRLVTFQVTMDITAALLILIGIILLIKTIKK